MFFVRAAGAPWHISTTWGARAIAMEIFEIVSTFCTQRKEACVIPFKRLEKPVVFFCGCTRQSFSTKLQLELRSEQHSGASAAFANTHTHFQRSGCHWACYIGRVSHLVLHGQAQSSRASHVGSAREPRHRGRHKRVGASAEHAQHDQQCRQRAKCRLHFTFQFVT